MDATRNAYVTGQTGSANFPTQDAIQPNRAANADAFVTKINAAGTGFVFSTYLGGDGIEHGFCIAVDPVGNVYVTGSTTSSNFPLENPIQPTFSGVSDAFVTKINSTGTGFIYSTYLGGSSGDTGLSIAADSTGSAYVTGATISTNFPTENAFQPTVAGVSADAFVTKISEDVSELLQD